jgi:chromosome condensin MukBEF complex kleisin-like MukF subunit
VSFSLFLLQFLRTEDCDNGDKTPWGLHAGALHLEAIKILINSLQLILDEVDNLSNAIVDFSCQHWARVFDALVHDVQESFDHLELTRFLVKEQSNVSSALKNVHVIVLQSWIGLLVLKCSMTLKKFFKMLL